MSEVAMIVLNFLHWICVILREASNTCCLLPAVTAANASETLGIVFHMH